MHIGDIGANGRAYKNILIQIHTQAVFLKNQLQNIFKTAGKSADFPECIYDFIDLCQIGVGQWRDIFNGICVRGNIQPAGERAYGV